MANNLDRLRGCGAGRKRKAGSERDSFRGFHHAHFCAPKVGGF
jgi:hypothetical protein